MKKKEYYPVLEEDKKISQKRLNSKLSNILEFSRDQFLANIPKQPKLEIANYVEQNGILVPERFEGLKQALKYIKSGGEIIIRSEHPQEYNGISGLFTSYTINQEIINTRKKFYREHKNLKKKKKEIVDIRWDIENEIFAQIENLSQQEFEERLKKLKEREIKKYCELIGINFEDFNKDISFSYWKKLSEFNRIIIADSAIPNRYHIFTASKEEPFLHNYLVIDNGEIVSDNPMKLPEEMKKSLPEVIEFYETIRKLDKFDPNHCPIVEFQTYQNNNYFLQYHRTRQIEPSTFVLDRNLEENEFEAIYVRGATPPEGFTLKVVLYYPAYQITEQEDGSFDFHKNFTFSEIMSRRRIANFFIYSMKDLSINCIYKHLSKSRLFNSQISLSIPKNQIPIDLSLAYEKAKKTNKPVTIPIRVVSDGRKAYVKFL